MTFTVRHVFLAMALIEIDGLPGFTWVYLAIKWFPLEIDGKWSIEIDGLPSYKMGGFSMANCELVMV